MTRHAYPLVLVVLLGIVFAPLLLQPNHLLYPRDSQVTDLTVTHWPAVAFNVRSLWLDGQFPLWRTSIASGSPWAANPQSWLFYPPAWLFYILPINLTFNLLSLSHLVLAALATYAFGRRALNLKPQGATLAGLAFALAPWLCGQLSAGHQNVIQALAWLPVALLAAHDAATTGRAGGAVAAGIAWAAAVLNHFQIAAFIAVLTLAWFLVVTVYNDHGTGRLRRVALSVFMPVIAVLLSACLLVPLAEALPYLNRNALTVQEAGIFSLSWSQLLTSIIPTFGGEPEQITYLGLPVAMLAAVGICLRRDRASRFFVITAVLAVLFAVGVHGPLYPFLFRWMPGLSWFRVPPRAWVLVAFSTALLAGQGLDALSRPNLAVPFRRRIVWIALIGLAIGLSLTVGLSFLLQPLPPAVWSLAAFTVLTAIALLLRARLLIEPRLFAVVVLLLAAADLGLVRTAWTEMRSSTDALAWGEETAKFLTRQPGEFRVYSTSYSLPQHTAIHYGLSLADAVDPFQLKHYADFMALAGGYEKGGYSPTLPPVLDDTSARPDASRLGLLNVGYVVASFPLKAQGLTLATQLGEAYIYHNEKVLPHAFTVVQPVTSGDVTLKPPIQATPAHIAVYTPNRIVVQVDSAEPALLVLGEPWYPGWHARVDNVEIPIQRVEGAVRGAFLDAGSHTVEFRYSPWTVWVGLAVTGSTMLLLLAWAAARAWRRR